MTTTVLTAPMDNGGSLRFFLVAPIAAATTAVLLTFMYKLVVTNFETPEEKPDLPIPEVSWETPTLEVRVDTSKPEIEDSTPPPAPHLTPDNPVVDEGAIQLFSMTKKSVVPEFDPGAFSDGMPIARVMVGAQYPSRAIAKGIEGYVDVQFDVAASGATENLQVVAFEPSTIFNRAALNAVSRWKFQPKMVNGKPVKFQGMVKRIRFEMQK